MAAGECKRHGMYYPAYPGCPECQNERLEPSVAAARADERRKTLLEAAQMAYALSADLYHNRRYDAAEAVDELAARYRAKAEGKE